MAILPDDYGLGTGSSGGGELPPGIIEVGPNQYYNVLTGKDVDRYGNPITAAASYSEKHFYSGPDGPGYYAVDANGNPTGPNLKPDSVSSGGGSGSGSGPIQYGEPYHDDNLGAWVQVDSRGNISILSRDSTGGAAPQSNESYPGSGITSAGVSIYAIPSGKSPTGYVTADGTIIYANGADAGMGKITDQQGAAGTWTGYGPKGQGTYYLDGPGGTPGTYIGPTTAAGAGIGSSSSGGGSLGSTTTKIYGSSSGGGGGGGSSSQYDPVGYAQMTQAVVDREAQLQALKAQYDRSGIMDAGTAASLAQSDAHFQQTYGLSVQQFQHQLEKDREQQQSQDIRDFRDAVSDVDPAKYRAQLFAQGIGAGGNIANRISEGENFLSDNANAGAAALLSRIRGGYQNQYAQIAGLPSGSSTATPGGDTPAAGVPPGTSANAVPAPAAGLAPQAQQNPTVPGNWRMVGDRWQEILPGGFQGPRNLPFIAGDINGPTNWAAVPGVKADDMGWAGIPSATGEITQYYNLYDHRLVPADKLKETRIGDAIANGPRTGAQNVWESLYTDKDGIQRFLGSGGANADVYR